MKKDPFGVFEIVIPAKDGQPAIAHNSKIKVRISGSAVFILLIAQDLSNHPIRRTNRTHTGLDHICHPGPEHLPRLRCTISEPSCKRTICLQAPPTEEARERTSLRSTRWDLISRIESVYLRRVHEEYATENTSSWIQCHPTYGYHGARLLCKLRLPNQ